jgi:hypothetical protein
MQRTKLRQQSDLSTAFYVWGVYLAVYCLYVWGVYQATYCLYVWGVYLDAYACMCGVYT